MKTTVSIIAAYDNANIIGIDGNLPWRLPEDLKRFRKLTLGKAIIMGHGTFLSLPKRPLPGRENIVLSRDSIECGIYGTYWANSLQSGIHAACAEEVFVIGGQEVFAEALPIADKLYLTRVYQDNNPSGARYFPEIDFNQWRCDYTFSGISESGGVGYSFHDYQKIGA
jgi:dihydrofolate reductase